MHVLITQICKVEAIGALEGDPHMTKIAQAAKNTASGPPSGTKQKSYASEKQNKLKKMLCFRQWGILIQTWIIHAICV